METNVNQPRWLPDVNLLEGNSLSIVHCFNPSSEKSMFVGGIPMFLNCFCFPNSPIFVLGRLSYRSFGDSFQWDSTFEFPLGNPWSCSWVTWTLLNQAQPRGRQIGIERECYNIYTLHTVYIYIHIIYICIYIHTRLYIYTHNIYIYIYIHMPYVHMYIYICIYIELE